MNPQKGATRLNKLWDIVPNSGMKYLEKKRVMHRRRRDKQVANALENACYELSAADLSRAFIPMFQIATPIFIDARAEGKDLWDMLLVVQGQLDWARRLSEPVFFELFTRLVEARYRWEKEPVSPFFDYHQYAALVVALVNFRKAVGDCPQEDSLSGPNYKSWILAEAEVYNVLAGGLDEDDGDTGTTQPDERDDIVPPMQKMAIEKPDEHPDAMQLGS